MASINIIGSFRDPSGFLFREGGILYRQVNGVYREHYERLMESGLYESLVKFGMLIPHKEANLARDGNYKVLEPELVDFISYPYEWSFSQLKDAALLMLRIQTIALGFGMGLKDASAYNIQFHKGRPMLIDTLSFEIYKKGETWVAYRQFCEHFLCPLALMAYKDVRLSQLLRIYLDGIPLNLAIKLLPKRAYLNIWLLVHLKVHSMAQGRYAHRMAKVDGKVSLNSMLGIVDSLKSCISKLRWEPKGTEWADYYESGDNSAYMNHKRQLVSEFLDKASVQSVWDLGANTGLFSHIASDKGMRVVSFDIDPACVEMNYLDAVKRGEENILPLLLDLTNPSPSIGWANEERLCLWKRGNADMAMALALVHHLAISNNLSFAMIAKLLSSICSWLIIEFIPKDDTNTQLLLTSRKDTFPDYNRGFFEKEFGKLFQIEESVGLKDSVRTLYLMKRLGYEKI